MPARPASWASPASARLTDKYGDVPTLPEQGLDVTAAQWYVIFGPKGMTAAQTAYWETVLTKMMKNKEIEQFADSLSWYIKLMGSKELPAYFDKESASLHQILDELGLIVK